MAEKNEQKNKSRKEEPYIYSFDGEPGKPDMLLYSHDLITSAIAEAIGEIRDSKLNITYDPSDSPERLFRKVYDLLLPPTDEQHSLYDREGEIKGLTGAALKYFTENMGTFIFTALYELVDYAIGHASSIYLENMGEDKKTIREFLPRSDSTEDIRKATQKMKGGAIQTYGSGGDRRPKAIRDLWTDENCKRFVHKVNELHNLWKHIKECYDDPSPSMSEWLSRFKQHRKGCHECQEFERFYLQLNEDLLLNIANVNLCDRDREALGLACIHAARELGFTREYLKLGREELDSETLRQYYYKGLSLL